MLNLTFDFVLFVYLEVKHKEKISNSSQHLQFFFNRNRPVNSINHQTHSNKKILRHVFFKQNNKRCKKFLEFKLKHRRPVCVFTNVMTLSHKKCKSDLVSSTVICKINHEYMVVVSLKSTVHLQDSVVLCSQ